MIGPESRYAGTYGNIAGCMADGGKGGGKGVCVEQQPPAVAAVPPSA